MHKRYAVLMTIVLMLSASATIANASSESYVIDLEGKKQAIPLTYSVGEVYSYFNLGIDTLSAPTDIYIDRNDCLYILDAGNGRILKLSKEGAVLAEFTPQGDDKLNNPSGIFVDDKGFIYAADTGNGRVMVFDKEGNAVNRLTQPDSPLFDKAYPFKPLKVEVDKLGQIYVINDLDYHGFTILDSDDNFKGYLAATRLSSDFWGKLLSSFASKSQKEQMGKRIPPQHTNFTIADDGSLYTTTANVSTEQLKRYSAVGNNFYPFTGAFGDASADYIMTRFGKSADKVNFADVCVDGQGAVSILDNLSGRIYQYDQDGKMIGVFGGTGNWGGRFMNAVAIDNDSEGNLYVLDQTLNSVKVFKPTRFLKNVENALQLYDNGKYAEASVLWEEILKSDSQYYIAHIGMGKSALKNGDYLLSMEHYRSAGDKSGYSDAFAAYRKQFVQRHFLLIVALICALAAAAYVILSRFSRKAKKLADSPSALNGGQIAVLSLFAPGDGFYAIKTHRERFAVTAPVVILLVSVASSIAKPFLVHYPLTTVNILDLNLQQEVFSFAVPFFLWVFGYYYVTCVFNGEIMLREVFATTSYALLPYALFTIPVALFTNVLGIESAGLVNTLNAIIALWVVILVVWGVRAMNSFSASQTLLVILSSVFAVLFIAVVMVLLYVLGMKLYDFVAQLVNEYKLLLLK